MYSYIQIEENITYFGLPFSNEKVRIVVRSRNRKRVKAEYHFEGDNFLCNWLKEKVLKDQFHVQC